MSNPFEFREVMKAAFHYNTDKTVDQVIAEHKAKHEREMKEAEAESKARSKRKGSTPAGSVEMGTPREVDMAALRKMLENATPRPAPLSEVVSPPDE